MEIHFLGTTGYHPNRRRDTACFMIPEHGIVLDAGTGIFRARELLQTPELHIFLSHTHLDHVVGLTFLLDVMHQTQLERVWVYCDPTKQAAITEHLFNKNLFPVAPPFKFRPLDGRPVSVPGGGTLTTFPLQHPGGCLGFRFDWPQHSLAYVTDTTAEPNANYIKSISNVDALIHECYFPDGCEDQARLTGHSCLTPVAHVAARAQAKRTFLVHLSPLDESDALLDLSSVEAIYPGMHVPVDGEMTNI